MAVVPARMGCSSGGMHSKAQNASDLAERDTELTTLRVQLEEREQALRTLEGQLALAQAQVQELEGRGRPSAGRAVDLDSMELPWSKPVVVDERLPITAEVADLPGFEDASPAPVPEAPEPAEPAVSVEGYRRGLQLVRDRRFDEAWTELDAFFNAHPSHPYADNALYWCGEIHYLRHEYERALEVFERLHALYPTGNKAPDALYRMGQIHLRRGDKARARAYFEEVREQFPDTAAARLALREDAS